MAVVSALHGANLLTVYEETFKMLSKQDNKRFEKTELWKLYQ
jgi:hypothetical protein